MIDNIVCRPWFRTLLLLVMISAMVGWTLLADSEAQITLDGSVGPSGNLTGPEYMIPATVGQQLGENLFHSFGDFNVNTGESATFTGPASVSHIIGRVTGENPSNLDGLLRSEIAGASLYLFNPQGVMLGPNASLDVSGSLRISTADALRFQDGAAFAADLSAQSTLTAAAPSAFGFLQAQPARITVQGSHLEVLEGETLSLLGGDIEMTGDADSAALEFPTLSAPGGRLHLVSVGSPGEVTIHTSETSLGLSVDAFDRLGAISIVDGAFVSTSSDGGGTVTIRGERLRIDGAFVTSETFGSTHGATMGLDIEMTGDVVVTNESLLSTNTFGEGSAGGVQITAHNVDVVNGTVIDSTTFDRGQGGHLTIRAIDSVTITGSTSDGTFGSAIFVNTLGPGAGGETSVEAAVVTLSDGGQIDNTAFDAGRGGNVTIRAHDSVTVTGSTPDGTFGGIFAQAQGSGAGGNTLIESPTVTLSDGGRIDNATFLSGRGGDVTIRSSDSVTITGSTFDGGFFSGIVVETQGIEADSGAGGNVLVEAPVVTLSSGGNISALTSGAGPGGSVTIRASEMLSVTGTINTSDDNFFISRIGAQSVGTDVGSGPGGEVLVEAPMVTLSDGGQIVTTTLGPGQGGNVTVRASEALIITGSRLDPTGNISSGIFATTQGRVDGGVGGNVRVEAPVVTLSGGGRINSTNSGAGQGGDVTLVISDLLTVTGSDANGFASGILTEASDTSLGQGGDIDVRAREIQFVKGATITARSTGTGNAGDVMISASETFLSDMGTVTTEATQADGGNITLMARDRIQLRDSQVEANVGGGADTVGGNIVFDPEFVIIQNSRVVASAIEGRGGNIQIVAQNAVLVDPNSVLDASSELGIDGSVDVQAPITDLSGTVTPLTDRFIQASALLASRCAGRLRQGSVGRFVVAGRDGLPIEPGSILPSSTAASSEAAQLERTRSDLGDIKEPAPKSVRLVSIPKCP